MKAILVLCIIIAVSFAAPIFRDGKILDDSKVPALNPKLVSYINSLETSWKADNHAVKIKILFSSLHVF